MLLVEIDDEDMRVLFNLATRCHTSHLRVHVYLAIFNLLAETASSLHVLDMPLVEIDDEDMKVLFNLATRYHTFRICESMKIDQTLPFQKATVRPRLQGRLHCRYHCSFTICNGGGRGGRGGSKAHGLGGFIYKGSMGRGLTLYLSNF
jgi:hypothetical protein